MAKYRVQLREVIFTEIEVDAENLTEASRLVEQAREEAGIKISEETDELVARIYHARGEKELRLI